VAQHEGPRATFEDKRHMERYEGDKGRRASGKAAPAIGETKWEGQRSKRRTHAIGVSSHSTDKGNNTVRRTSDIPLKAVGTP
jgi:hypothetical protein